MKKRWLLLLALTFVFFGVYYGCGGGGSAGSGNVMGTVTDMAGLAVEGVTVTAVGTSSTDTTDDEGYFQILGLSESNHQVLTFAKTGYVTTTQIARIQPNMAPYINLTIAAYAASETFSAVSAKTISDSTKGDVAVSANSLDATGNVTVNLTAFDSTAVTTNTFPGEYIGVTDGDLETAAPLQSFGYAGVNATDADGNEIGLKAGSTATVRILIPAALQATAEPTIDLWHFNETSGVWEKAGTGTKTGNYYVAQVTSFSTWNYDVAYNSAYVTGTVTDCDTGDPIEGAQVYVLGNGWRSGETGTDSSGTFPNPNKFYTGAEGWKGIPVQPTTVMVTPTFTIYAQKNGMTSSTQPTVTAPNAGEVVTVPLCIYTIGATYSGTYGGDDSGTFWITVSQDGLVTGGGVSAYAGGFSLSGHVGPNGTITAGTASIEGTTFTGTINGETGVVSGDWASGLGWCGTFLGAKTPTS